MSTSTSLVERGSAWRCTARPRDDRAGKGGLLAAWVALVSTLVISTLGTSIARADWPPDGVGLAPYTPPGSSDATAPRIIPDGTGGAIVTWLDSRSGVHDIYAQRVSASGTVKWTTNGVPLCTAGGDRWYLQITPDGSGGAIVTWVDYRSENDAVYAQRVSASGVVQWTTDGVPLCTAPDYQHYPEIAPDGSGGAIVTWVDRRSGNDDIYAQRVSASGVVQWIADGVPLCTAASYQVDPHIAPDGAGGAIVTWVDSRSGEDDVYAQRVSASGVVQWIADGVPLCTGPGLTWLPRITPDGFGGAIVTWQDNRNGYYADIYAQRVDASGAAQWITNGVPLCTQTSGQAHPEIAPDGSGGAIVTWVDSRGGDYDIYAQRVNASGVVQWTTNGVPLCTTYYDQENPRVAADGSGGAIVTWEDYRTGMVNAYAQRVNASGAAQWTGNGVRLCLAFSHQESPQITPDGGGGAIVTWQDDRSENYDVYAQRVNASGALQWTTDGVPLCAAGGVQVSPQIAPDGSGGTIVTWEDCRNGNVDIYTQRMNANGEVLWSSSGVPLCAAASHQWSPWIAPDGSCGAIVTWRDERSGENDIYAQRVNANGEMQWSSDGVPVCTAAGYQDRPRIAPDGSGGAIFTWQDSRGGNLDIYAQRVSASGEVQWATDGVPVCATGSAQFFPHIVPDGSGGAIVTWDDDRNGNYDIYAQRVNASGAVQWTAVGVPLCTAGSTQWYPLIVPDGSGGAVVTWEDRRSANEDIYAQRVSGSGAVQWTADGVPLCAAEGEQYSPQIAPNGSGGAIVTWVDRRSGNDDVYVQGVSASGAVQWTTDGVPLCTAMDDQGYSQIAPDGTGGAIVTWQDSRSGLYDIYAQRVNASGDVQWAPDGVPLCTANDYQGSPQIAADGSGCAIVTWVDCRSGENQIYAQRTECALASVTGLIGRPWMAGLLDVAPNPFTGTTTVRYSLAEAARVRMEVFDAAGRRVWEWQVASQAAGLHTAVWDGRTSAGAQVGSGIYYLRLSAAEGTWTRPVVLLK